MDFRHTVFLLQWRCCVIAKEDILINEEITAKEVRMINEDGVQVGIVDIQTALKYAEDRNLDLVNVAPMAVPPVCKVMDYSKYIFDLNKKEKDAKKNQKTVDIKEVRLTLNIGEHDLQVKVKSAYKFLQDGDKVKVTVKFYGREMTYTKSGDELLDRFSESMSEVGVMDKKPKMEGRRMTAMFSPKK